MNEARNTVEDLNDILWSKEKNHDHSFIYTSCGVTDAISVRLNYEDITLIIELWNDQNDTRFFHEEHNVYEPLSDTILRAFNDAQTKLTEINLDLNE